MPTATVTTKHAPQMGPTRLRCVQLTYSETGEEPVWVNYDPDQFEAIAHLRNVTPAARFELGAAGFDFSQQLDVGEVWLRPHGRRRTK